MNNIIENNTIDTSKEEKFQKETLSVYKGMNEVFDHTRKIIDEMKLGEKITVKDLADKVHSQITDISSGNVTNLVQLFVKQCKDVSVEIGRGGGVFKGGKPKRIDLRPRCTTCNQVVRSDIKNNTQNEQA